MKVWAGNEDIKTFIDKLAVKFPNAGYDSTKVNTVEQIQFLGCSFYNSLDLYESDPESYPSLEDATECCFDDAWRLMLKGDY